jgi:hypothetical protein
MNAVSLRQPGGVYFAPAGGRDSLFRLRRWRNYLWIALPVMKAASGAATYPVHSTLSPLLHIAR